MTDAFRRDINAMYATAEQAHSLPALIPVLCDMLRRNGDSLVGITYAYRLTTIDTDYSFAFSLTEGAFCDLSPSAPVDVVVSGREANLLAVFQRRLNPAKALLLRKIRVDGSMAALMELASFL
ncbi:MAG: SCP2 sterol-binding domain-containing protein [Eubacteriales bacterium]|nr:SCP2 sterol-binding domain-containing protein [Eubacteriales bacterium]